MDCTVSSAGSGSRASGGKKLDLGGRWDKRHLGGESLQFSKHRKLSAQLETRFG